MLFLPGYSVCTPTLACHVRAAMLRAVGTCGVFSFGVMLGWCCFLRVTTPPLVFLGGARRLELSPCNNTCMSCLPVLIYQQVKKKSYN